MADQTSRSKFNIVAGAFYSDKAPYRFSSWGPERWNLILTQAGECSICNEYGMITVHEGDLLLCAPSKRRDFFADLGWKTMWFHIDWYAVPSWRSQVEGLYIIHPDPESWRIMLDCAGEVYHMAMNLYCDWLPLAGNLLESIILRANFLTKNKSFDPKLADCENYLFANTAFPGMDALAKKFGMSRTVLFQNFKKTYGCTPHDYYEQNRFHKVKQLLLNTNFSFSEIAQMTGFPNSAYLAKRFKKFCGTTMRNFQRQSRGI